jgi:hypothetical protein
VQSIDMDVDDCDFEILRADDELPESRRQAKDQNHVVIAIADGWTLAFLPAYRRYTSPWQSSDLKTHSIVFLPDNTEHCRSGGSVAARDAAVKAAFAGVAGDPHCLVDRVANQDALWDQIKAAVATIQERIMKSGFAYCPANGDPLPMLRGPVGGS